MKSPDRIVQTMQIGMTASRDHMSGTDRYYQELLRALPQFGIGVRGMVIGDPQGLEDPMPGVESFAREGTGRIAKIRGARDTAKKLLPGTDLVVSHGAPHTCYVLDRLGGRPLVSHFHGPWALEGRDEGVGRAVEFFRRAQEAAVYRRSLRYITLSRAFAATLQREYGVAESNVRVIPGGVDTTRFKRGESRDEARARLGWPADRPIVLATRRLEPTKGIGALIEAMARVRADVPNALAILTGTGSLGETLRARVRELGIEQSVRFLGHVAGSELPTMYRAADLSIVPSNAWEGFGLSVAESLACGTPALVTPVGGLPEVVSDLAPRLVLRDTSAECIATGLLQVLKDRSVVPGRDACIAYAARFAWSAVARRVSEIYREVA